MSPTEVNFNDPAVFSPARLTTLGSLTSLLVQNAYVIAGILAFLLIVVAGFQIVTAASSGESKKMEKGRQAMTAAVIGLLVIIGAVWIVQILGIISGVNLLRPGA